MSDTTSKTITTPQAYFARATAELRFVERSESDGLNIRMVRVLQQAWELVEFDANDRVRACIKEWRDVPLACE